MEKVIQNKMGYEKEGPLLFKMSMPLVFSMLLQSLYNVVDSIFVTRLSEDALTAVSLGFPVQMLMTSIAVGTSIGTNALISRKLGEGNLEEANRAAAHGTLLQFLSSLLFVFFGLFLVTPFFRLFTAGEPDITAMGITYLRICTICSTGMFLQIGTEKILQAEGHTVPTMFIMATGAIVNIIFDPLLIFGLAGFPRMGIAGAAVATVGAQWVSMALGFVLLRLTNTQVQLTFRRFRLQLDAIRQIYSVGLPSIIMQSIGTVMNMAVNKVLIAYTTTAVAIFGIYFKVQSIVFMPVFGMTGSAMSILAFNYGAGLKKRLMKTHHLAMISSLIYMTCGMILFLTIPEKILAIFDASPEAVAIGVRAFRILGLCFPLASYSICCSTLFQALNRGFYSMLISISRQLLVLVPLAIALSALTHELNSVWLAWPIAEVISVAVTVGLYLRVRSTVLDRMTDRSGN